MQWCIIFKKWVQKLVAGKSEKTLTPLDAEALRTAFQTRYHNFKLLLSANNKALQIMSELEEARKGDVPFGMSFIRANCTAVSVSVLRMIRSMDQLAPGRYEDLHECFGSIQGRIAGILSEKKESVAGERIIFLQNVDKSRSDEVGSKMANLGEIRNRLGIRVPNGFTVSARAFREFIGYSDLQVEIDRIMQSSPVEEMDQLFSLSAQIQQQIIQARMPPDLEGAISSAYGELAKQEGQGVKVSLRSSALGEDSGQNSFAGLYRTELNVSADDLIDAYKEIAASKYSLQAIIYRLNRGIRDEDIDMCVGCMSMVNAVAGGVIYSGNPIDARDERIFIHSAFGLPKSVVDGSVSADLFVISRNPVRIEKKHIAEKRQKFVCYPAEGVCRLEIVGKESSQASIDEGSALELARIALKIEDHYGFAQDIEWALDEKGESVILQCRPLRQKNAPSERWQRAYLSPCDVIASGGLTASPGAGFGPVFAVRKESDVLLFPKGAVLVVRQAIPRWAALLGRASGLVAEQGTVAGHLANVAREFGVPAILGLEGAIDLLENGRPVTVDADGRRVCDGRIEPLLANREIPRSLMDGSPVLDMLNRVSEHIIPLHFLDPEAADFKPSMCRTFHDMTRFCHEKAIMEMFSFGRDHHFSERAGKQLVWDKIPMQWWVLNLDDGFMEDVRGRFVNLENIVSIPMLALWAGIVAVPWQGPPPVDARGFISILMEAGSNPALDPCMPSPYADHNYFMISKDFCSLSSRFGFHFSNIEALVCERANENYTSFTFKGGAADYERRVRRARFVGDLLEEFEFRCEVMEDGLTAHVEGYDETRMKEKLRILGYLLIHTRQLDMVMFNDASCAQLKGKLLADIDSAILSSPSRGAAFN